MLFYKIDYAIGKIFTTEPRQERILIKKYTGTRLSERDAMLLWERIADHKWYLSERLKRDVGFHVAAVDYVENFYEPRSNPGVGARLSAIWRAARPAITSYFEAKGTNVTY